MKDISPLEEFSAAVTICDRDGTIRYMNSRAAETFKTDGGAALVGKSLFDCHPEPAKSKLRDMIKSGKINAYTIEKNGVKKLIYQAPWYDNGNLEGIIELSVEIPFDMPHFVRK